MTRPTALALLFAGPAMLPAETAQAAEQVPVLHVAERTPELASVHQKASEREEHALAIAAGRVATNRIAAAQLTSADGGWVAREAIGKQVPLRDPAADAPEETLDQLAPTDDPPATQEPVAVDSEQESVADSDQGDAPESGEASEGSASEGLKGANETDVTGSGPISLKSLKPVPLMAPQTEPSPHQDKAALPESDRSAEADDELMETAAPEESEQTEQTGNVAQRTKPETALPVRRPAIDSDDDTENSGTEISGTEISGTEISSSVGDLDAGEFDVAAEVEPARPEQQTPPIMTASVARLQRPIEQCLNYYYQRPENAAGRSAWGLMHSIMVYGVDTQVISGRKRYNAIAWLAGNNICRGKRLLTVDRQGIAPRQGVGLQGHQGQLLAILGLVGVPKNYPLYVDRQKFTVEDLIAHEQRECRSGTELTFTLIALAHYIDTDSEWRSKDGQHWDFERLLQEELAQPVIGSACGGTHRLMGFSHAVRIRKEKGLPITGQWARADTFIQDFTDYAWKLQNRDGSMSTNWFEGRGDSRDLDRKIQTTGHVVEWMLAHMPDDQLQDERLVRAVRFLTTAMSNNPAREKEIGPKGHALRSLAVYHQRVFGAPNPWDSDRSSGGSQATRRRGSSSYR